MISGNILWEIFDERKQRRAKATFIPRHLRSLSKTIPHKQGLVLLQRRVGEDGTASPGVIHTAHQDDTGDVKAGDSATAA
jgi:hypothetical protein